MQPVFWLLLVAALLTGALIRRRVRRHHLSRWLLPHLVQSLQFRGPRPGQDIHLILCIADHFEPWVGGATADVARARTRRWVREYPLLFDRFRDSDGKPPQHTFFYPLEDYDPEHIEMLAELCRAGFGEVEVHLHHDHDTAVNLRRRLLDYRELLARKHGLLARDRTTGAAQYAFVHGNWALDNSRPDGRWCGVNNELEVLRETGCYADFTLPSAPGPAQTRKINSIYYAAGKAGCCNSHDRGHDVGHGPPPARSLLLLQGPLLLDWGRRKLGLLPRIENGCLQGSQPPSFRRLHLWLKAGVQVPTRPDWFFVKLHTHGAAEANARVLLDEPMQRFHQALAEKAASDPHFHFHYATAREAYNLAKAAEAGWTGSVAAARDYQLLTESGRNDASRGCQKPEDEAIIVCPSGH